MYNNQVIHDPFMVKTHTIDNFISKRFLIILNISINLTIDLLLYQ